MPAGCFIAGVNVLACRKARRAIDGDLVIVPQHDQTAEAQMPCKTDRLMVDALHQAAIARDHPGPVVDQFIAKGRVQMALSHCHANCAIEESRGGKEGVSTGRSQWSPYH